MIEFQLNVSKIQLFFLRQLKNTAMKLGHISYFIYYYFTHLKSKSQNYLLKNVKYATRKHSYSSLYHDKINDIIFARIFYID